MHQIWYAVKNVSIVFCYSANCYKQRNGYCTFNCMLYITDSFLTFVFKYSYLLFIKRESFKSFDTTISISKGYIIRTNPSSKRIKHYPNSKEFQALKIRLLSKNIINIISNGNGCENNSVQPETEIVFSHFKKVIGGKRGIESSSRKYITCKIPTYP